MKEESAYWQLSWEFWFLVTSRQQRDPFDTRDSPRTRSMVIAAVQWAKRIMLKVDEECGK
jgi:hypothetical protein